MENIDNILNSLVAKLFAEGNAEFSQNGLNIKTSYDNGCLSISASFESPKEDETNELVNSFEEYIKSLNDDFFLEAAESFESGQLKEIQNMLDSKDLNTVKQGIDLFMNQLKNIAASKIELIDNDIQEVKKELSDLLDIRNSYIHVLDKKF